MDKIEASKSNADPRGERISKLRDRYADHTYRHPDRVACDGVSLYDLADPAMKKRIATCGRYEKLRLMRASITYPGSVGPALKFRKAR